MCSYALRNERNKKRNSKKFHWWLLLPEKYCPSSLSILLVYMINSPNEWMIGISKWICLCVGMQFEIKHKKKQKDEEIASCIYVYVCLSVMIDLRSIQSMCGETWRRVYWYISRGTSYLDIDIHHTSEDKKNCNRDEHFFSDLSLSPCSFIELKEIKRGDIDLSSSTTRHRWFPPWEEMPCLIYINQLSLLFPKRLDE